MQFRVLRPVEVASGERRMRLTSARQGTILSVLLAAGGDVVSADRLVDALWGEEPPSSALKTLRSHVSQLRRDLEDLEAGGAGAVATEGGGYRVNLEGHVLDAAHFEDGASRAAAALPADPALALQLLDEALGRWRGAAFGAFADHPLVRIEALRLEQLRATATADHVEARLAVGRHREVVGELEAMVAAELDERVHGQLMLALYRSGRQADALATYRRLRDRLRDDLGVDPSPQLQSLHEAVLRQDAALSDDRAFRASTLSRKVRFRSPSPSDRPAARSPGLLVGGLLGRHEEVASVASLVSTNRLVSLTGPGGVGKTRLAEQVAAEVSDRFDDGVAMCALSAVRDAGSVGPALVDALGVEHSGRWSAEDVLVAAVGSRRLLLVLDNCEHLLDAVAGIVDRILRRCESLAVLVTSRERLHLPEERIWQVAPLRLPRPEASAKAVVEAPAGALFVARAEAADPTFALTEGNAGAVAELCRRLDGLPLAIELAAARVRAITPQDLVARLHQRFVLLAGGPFRDAGRHRTLQAVVDWSYDLLPKAEARLFDRLSVFAGGFSLSAAERVCAGPPVAEEEVAGLLVDLVDKSMVGVERAQGGGRYRLLETLREFGGQRLAASGAADTHRRAHAAYHLSLVEDLSPDVCGPDEGAAVAEIDRVVDDLRLAHDWAVGDGDVDTALRLPVALYEYLLFRLRAEVVTWAERALELPHAEEHPAYPAALATVALGATNRGDLEHGHRRAEAALAHAEPESFAAMRAVAVLSQVALYEGRLDDVLAIDDRLAVLAAALDHPYWHALAGLDATLALHYRGDRSAATARAAELEQAAEATGNPTLRAWALYVHGEARLDVDPPEAMRRLQSAVELAREVGSRLPEGVALTSLASVCARHGDADRALALFRATVRHWRRLGDQTHQLTTLRNLVDLLVRVGADDAAAVLYGAATRASPPSFGAEADRLAAAWRQLERRLGAEYAVAAARRGRALTPVQMTDEALATLDILLQA